MSCLLRRLCTFVFACMAGAVVPSAAALTVTDDRGVTVAFEQPPRRIVSLLPSLTETVCALGACDRLVGVDRNSNHPPQVRALPVAGDLALNLEAVVALRPELVLASTTTQGLRRLEGLGVKVLAFEARNLADVRRSLDTLALLFRARSARSVWQEIDDGVTAAGGSLSPAARRSRVFFEVSPGPYAAGASSFIGELLQRLGVQNVVGAEYGPFPRLNPEFVPRADPDLVMVTTFSAPDLAKRPGWARMRALREGRVCVFDTAQADVLVRPGPRMAEAARLLAGCIADKGMQ